MSGRGYERKNIKTKTSSKNHIQQTLKNEYNDEETNNFGFELHQLGIYGICEKCGDKWPENQICPGEKDLCDLTFKRTNTGWENFSRRDDPDEIKNALKSIALPSPSDNSNKNTILEDPAPTSAPSLSERGSERKNIKTKASSKKRIKHSESSKLPIKKRKLKNISEETNDFGFELHNLGQYGVCEKCSAKWPENQICPGQYQPIGWENISGRDGPVEIKNAVKPTTALTLSDNSNRDTIYLQDPKPTSTPSLLSTSQPPEDSTQPSTSKDTDKKVHCVESFPVDDQISRFRQSTVRDDNDLACINKSSTCLDSVFIPCRHPTSPDSEMWYLKSDGVYKIPIGKSEVVKTTAFLDYMGSFPHVCRIEGITLNNHWLGQPIDASLAVRTGAVNPQHTGFLELCIFNKGQRELIIKAGSPIAVLKRENYLY